MVGRVAIVLALAAGLAHADASQQLRSANVAATSGDWGQVSALVDPLIAQSLTPAELAEANRLYGLAAFFQGRYPEAEAHFLAYLKIDLDGQLDPQLYPPEAISFFTEVRTKHAAELRARRPKQKHYFILSFLPPVAQFQNGDRVKGVVLGSMIGAFAIANISSALVLRSWCTPVTGEAGSSVTCNDTKNHDHAASQLRTLNIVAGIALIATVAYGVYDGVTEYRRHESAVQPYASVADGSSVVGLAGTF